MTAKASELKRKLLQRCGVPGEYIDLDRSASFLSELSSNPRQILKPTKPPRASLSLGNEMKMAILQAAQRDQDKSALESIDHSKDKAAEAASHPDNTVQKIEPTNLQPCAELLVTKSRRHLMRQVSALGMGDVTTQRHKSMSKQLFEDMSANAVPEDMRDMFSIYSDPTAEPGQGLDTKQYYSALGKNTAAVPKYPERGSDDSSDDTTISSCSYDIGHDDRPSSRLDKADSKPNDVESKSHDSCSLQEIFHSSNWCVSDAPSNDCRSSPQDRLDDSHQLLMEAALACREGTAWCSKGLAQAALEQSFSHLSRVSVPRRGR